MNELTRRLAPLLVLDRWSIGAFVTSMVIGLGALAIAGRAFAGVNQFDHFVRFHPRINPTTFYYPTASQVIEVARASARPDQILVVVGGSSVMYGAGEGGEEVWTLKLKDLLGDRFGVVNLALPSGAPAEHGSVAAQALIKEGRPVIFVTQVFPGFSEADGFSYRYIVWDALMKGLLPASAERDAALRSPSFLGPSVDAEREDLRVRSEIDRVLYFTDFWQAIGYRYAFTLWEPTADAARLFTTPRVMTSEPFTHFPADFRYPPAHDEAQMKVVTGEVEEFCTEQSDASWQPKDQMVKMDAFIHTMMRPTILPDMRERSIVLATVRSPYFAKRLPDAARQCWLESYRAATARLGSNGYHAVLIGDDWNDEDFVDVQHPSASGGGKMAAELAPIIRDLAAQVYPEFGTSASDMATALSP